MSKTFETNALKGKSLAAGMKRRIAELEKYGVKEADLTAMEQDADRAIEMIREVDRLREEIHQETPGRQRAVELPERPRSRLSQDHQAELPAGPVGRFRPTGQALNLPFQSNAPTIRQRNVGVYSFR